MKWFNNLKIRSKLILGFGAVIVMAIILAVIAVTQLISVNDYYETIFAGAVTRRGAANTAQSNVRGFRRVVTSSVMVAPLDAAERTAELNSLLREAEDMRDEIWYQLDVFDYSVRNEPGETDAWRTGRLEESADARRLFSEYYDVLMQVQMYAHAGNHFAAYNATIDGRAIVGDLISITDEMVATANARMDRDTALASDTADAAMLMVIVLAVVIVIVAVILALYIAGAIAKPVQNLVKLTGDVSGGQLNINMNRANLTTDEIGSLTADIYNLVDVIKGIVNDINIFSNEINSNGELDYRIDSTKYQGGYAEMVESLNLLTGNLIGDMRGVIGMLEKVSAGNFEIKMTQQLPGKKAVINKASDSLQSNLDSVIGEINTMIESAAQKGDLTYRSDAEKYKGGWKKIMAGLNDFTEAVDKPLAEIREVMDKLSGGDFSKNVTGKYAGDFKQIQDAVNGTISNLSVYINEIAEILAAISNGNLTTSISREYVGSFNAIKDSLTNITRTLHKTMSEITSASDQVFSGAKQISASAMDLASGASTQASSIEELNASVDLINQQTQANATNANEANSLSQTSTSNARAGNDAMQQTLGAMNQIKDSSDNISKIIKTIQDIAFQTNLLALNAAVEAARAGEHGKGFAVVAEEVRSLAARSQQAAGETTELINTSITTVETGSGIAQSTAETLNTIVDNANKVLAIVSNISNASNEQAEAITQVSQGVNQISQVVQSNSAVSEETAAAAQELTSQAELLKQLVSYFKL